MSVFICIHIVYTGAFGFYYEFMHCMCSIVVMLIN